MAAAIENSSAGDGLDRYEPNRAALATAALSFELPFVQRAAKVRSPPNQDVQVTAASGPEPTFDLDATKVRFEPKAENDKS